MSPFAIPGAKTTLVLALTMTLIGFVGASGSLSALTTSTSELAAPDPSAPPEVAAAATVFLEAFLGAPLRRALSVANLLASAMLLVASFLLTARARSASWWTSQALWANAGYSAAAAAANAYLIVHNRSELLAFADAMLAAKQARGEPLPTDLVQVVPTIFVAVTVALGVLLVGIYLGLWRVARREDVQRFVRREES